MKGMRRRWSYLSTVSNRSLTSRWWVWINTWSWLLGIVSSPIVRCLLTSRSPSARWNSSRSTSVVATRVVSTGIIWLCSTLIRRIRTQGWSICLSFTTFFRRIVICRIRCITRRIFWHIVSIAHHRLWTHRTVSFQSRPVMSILLMLYVSWLRTSSILMCHWLLTWELLLLCHMCIVSLIILLLVLHMPRLIPHL